MIIFLYGQDSYRMRQKLEEIVEGYKSANKENFSLVKISAHEKDFRHLLDNLSTISIFGGKKLIIARDIFLNEKFKEEFLKEIVNLRDSKDIIIVFEENPDKRTALFKALFKNSKHQEFNLLDEKNIRLWLRSELEKNYLKADASAQNLLLSYIGNDLWRQSSEIKKLAAFKKDQLLSKEDVELQVRPQIENNIFKTIEAIAFKNKKEASQLLHGHLDNGDSPLYLLSMIAYQFRNLLIIKDLIVKKKPYSAILKKSGLHPFVVQKTYSLCNRFDFLELKKIYLRIFQMDSGIKVGKIDPETALDLLVSEI